MCEKFLLSNLSDINTVKGILEAEHPNDVYDLDPNLMLVTNDKSTTEDIHNLVDFERNKITGFIVNVTNIKGYFNTDFWEWIQARK